MNNKLSKDKLKASLIYSYVIASGDEQKFYEVIEEEIQKYLPKEDILHDIEIIKRNDDKWSLILFMNENEEHFYSLDMKNLL